MGWLSSVKKESAGLDASINQRLREEAFVTVREFETLSDRVAALERAVQERRAADD